jgi:hypothetical protein
MTLSHALKQNSETILPSSYPVLTNTARDGTMREGTTCGYSETPRGRDEVIARVKTYADQKYVYVEL